MSRILWVALAFAAGANLVAFLLGDGGWWNLAVAGLCALSVVTYQLGQRSRQRAMRRGSR